MCYPRETKLIIVFLVVVNICMPKAVLVSSILMNTQSLYQFSSTDAWAGWVFGIFGEFPNYICLQLGEVNYLLTCGWTANEDTLYYPCRKAAMKETAEKKFPIVFLVTY